MFTFLQNPKRTLFGAIKPNLSSSLTQSRKLPTALSSTSALLLHRGDMAFWGVELKPGKPYYHISSKTPGRLRLTQATFGFGISDKRSFVQCNVGNKSPVLLCCLLPEKYECCHLDLEFDEVDNVVFSVIGPRSVHLTGYYLSSNSRHPGFDNSSDSYGEDIRHSDNEKSNCSDEDDYEDSFINDGDIQVSSPSSAFSGEEMEEEMMTDKISSVKKASQHRRRLRKCQISESGDEGSMNLKSVSNGDIAGDLLNEDEDKIPISSLIGSNGTANQKKLAKDEVAKVAVDENKVDSSNGNADKSGDNGAVDAYIKRDSDIQHASATVKDLQQNEDELKAGKKKSKKRRKKESAIPPESLPANDKDSEIQHASATLKDLQQNEDEQAGKKKSKKRQKESAIPPESSPANDKKPDAHTLESDERKSKRKKRKITESSEKQAMPSEDGTSGLKTSSNGLLIEELQLGKPDGEVAILGRKVKIHYTGALKDGGHVYDSSIGSAPFKFRLGKGKAIQGLQLGLEGMRVGGRRRLTIPPELGYGSEGFADDVPPNSWLKIDIELLNVS